MKRIAKYLYSVLPFKRELFSFIKLFYSPSESIYRHLHFKGIIKLKVGEGRTFKMYHHGYIIENELFWKGLQGGWEKKSMELWMKLCKNANTVFDIGANTGVYALVAKTINNKAEVHCFEPIPKVFELLEENVALNNYDIKCHKVALSDHSGREKIYIPGNEPFEYSATINKASITDAIINEMETEVCDLASFIKANDISGIDLMKIDVENYEWEVLKGMRDYLEKFKPTMILEILEDDLGLRLDKLLRPLGYIYFDINDAQGTISKVSQLGKSSSYNYLVCSPEVAAGIGIS